MSIVSHDLRTLFFASSAGAPDVSQDYDIWSSTRASATAAFGAPVRVPELSSSAEDYPSWLSPDGCRIYLTRGQLETGYAVFVASRPK